MKTFGNLIKGIKNVYVDFSVSSSDNMLINSDAANMDGNATDFQDAFLTNFSKLGIRGIVVDDNVINDYLTLEEGVGIDLGYDIAQHLPISEMAQTLDVIYQLDADSVTSSVGLSMYLYEDGGIYLNDGPKYKDEYFSFRSNVNAIDLILWLVRVIDGTSENCFPAARGPLKSTCQLVVPHKATGERFERTRTDRRGATFTTVKKTRHVAKRRG
jgi:hypothetical protein